VSDATDILTEITAKFNSVKSVVKTVTNELQPLSELLDLRINITYPYSMVYIEGTEVPGAESTGDIVNYFLPITILTLVVRSTDLVAEMEAAVKEIRDFVTDPLNEQWNGKALKTELPTIARSVPWFTEERTPEKVYGIIDIRFRTLYRLTRGNS